MMMNDENYFDKERQRSSNFINKLNLIRENFIFEYASFIVS